MSLSGRLLFAVVAPAVGWIAKVTSIQFTLSILAGTMAVAFALMWIAYGRIPKKYFTVKDEVVDRL